MANSTITHPKKYQPRLYYLTECNGPILSRQKFAWVKNKKSSYSLDRQKEISTPWRRIVPHKTSCIPNHLSFASKKRNEFNALIKEWENDTKFESIVSNIVLHPAYQRIIGMGEVAIPMILQDLKTNIDNPRHWFWALQSIVGRSVIKPENRGRVVKMAQDWLEWGIKNEYRF